MDPHDDLVSAGSKALAKPCDIIIVHLPTPGAGGYYNHNYGCGGRDHNSINVDTGNPSVTVNLRSFANRNVNTEWYDPKDGTYHDKRTISGGGSVTFTPPFSGDAVLHIVSDGHQQRGDLNGDGQITSVDVLIALWMAVRGEHTPEADMNRDGMVTSLDALMILQVATNR